MTQATMKTTKVNTTTHRTQVHLQEVLLSSSFWDLYPPRKERRNTFSCVVTISLNIVWLWWERSLFRDILLQRRWESGNPWVWPNTISQSIIDVRSALCCRSGWVYLSSEVCLWIRHCILYLFRRCVSKTSLSMAVIYVQRFWWTQDAVVWYLQQEFCFALTDFIAYRIQNFIVCE